jgi:hypothetical protein
MTLWNILNFVRRFGSSRTIFQWIRSGQPLGLYWRSRGGHHHDWRWRFGLQRAYRPSKLLPQQREMAATGVYNNLWRPWVFVWLYTGHLHVLSIAQKVNSELLTITHRLGQSAGGILQRFPEMGLRKLCYKLHCGVAPIYCFFFLELWSLPLIIISPCSTLIFHPSTLPQSMCHSPVRLAYRLCLTGQFACFALR